VGAVIHLVCALGPVGELPLSQKLVDELSVEHRRALELLAVRRHRQAAFAPPIVEAADPRDLILATAARIDADLIVMGTHGRRGISRLVLGSVAEDIVRRAPCPVLAVRFDLVPLRVEEPRAPRAAMASAL
jgi:nucleotide-binding universal stress UspA family protein